MDDAPFIGILVSNYVGTVNRHPIHHQQVARLKIIDFITDQEPTISAMEQEYFILRMCMEVKGICLSFDVVSDQQFFNDTCHLPLFDTSKYKITSFTIQCPGMLRLFKSLTKSAFCYSKKQSREKFSRIYLVQQCFG